MRISDWSSDVCSSDLTASSTSGALLSAAWITRAPASAASADISTKSEWRAASSGGRVISAAASHPGASASSCNVTRVLSTAPNMTARIGPPDFGAVDAFPREYNPDGFHYNQQIERS